MPWFMVYVTIAVALLSVAGACLAKHLRHDPGRLVAIIAAAALWPVLVIGLVQFAGIRLYANSLRKHETAPATRTPLEPEPATAPMAMVDSLVRLAQQVGAKHPA